MEEMKKEQIPQIGSRLRQHILKIPEAVFQASGIIIYGRRIKSFVFTTDLAIIRNCDADAVFAVYPLLRSKRSAMQSFAPLISRCSAALVAGRPRE